jgi:Flp pilus assembly protein TadG
MQPAQTIGYRSGMTAYVILLLVLVTIVMVGSAFLDRRRARQIERDLNRMPADQRKQQESPSPPDRQDQRRPRG